MILHAHLQDSFTLKTSLQQTTLLKTNLGVVTRGDGYPEYDGPYEAIPKVSEQVFETKKKSMEDDFTVKEITYLKTPNASGGYTLTIGDI